MAEPVAQSPQQQHLVCLTSGHVDCPRYLRGVLFAGAPPALQRKETVSPAVVGAVLLLLGAIAASFGFLAVRGSFELPVPTATPPTVAALPSASIAIVPSISIPPPSVVPSTDPTSSPTPTASPTPSPTPHPTLAPTSAPTPKPTPNATPRPTSDRFAVLTKCPSTPDCWIYVIRSGDNLNSIANWFGVSYNRVLAMNPGLTRPIHAGEQLRIPTPTR
jgi:LysM domain